MEKYEDVIRKTTPPGMERYKLILDALLIYFIFGFGSLLFLSVLFIAETEFLPSQQVGLILVILFVTFPIQIIIIYQVMTIYLPREYMKNKKTLLRAMAPSLVISFLIVIFLYIPFVSEFAIKYGGLDNYGNPTVDFLLYSIVALFTIILLILTCFIYKFLVILKKSHSASFNVQ